MKIMWVADIDAEKARTVATSLKGCLHGQNVESLLQEHPIDVLVEATNSIGDAARYCLSAIRFSTHVVLMNAEVDLALSPLLQNEAQKYDVTVTSDAGDQHGVLATLITEAQMMGFDIVQAGNIKGFLDRDTTPESIAHEAKIRQLSAAQCCAYTDGTKLHIEMAVLANAFGYLPPDGGMVGPRAKNVHEALSLFDLESYENTPRIDYLLGAEPNGGVYLIVKAKRELPPQHAFYLNYYKLGKGPYYILYRPYHLCHLETPKAILAAVQRKPLLAVKQKCCDVYAHAKCPIQTGDTIEHAIGSAKVYGIVKPLDSRCVPITLLESKIILKQSVEKGEALTWDHLELPSCELTELWLQQQQFLQ